MIAIDGVLNAIGTFTQVVWGAIWLVLAIAFLVLGHTAGRLVGLGLLFALALTVGVALWRFARSS